MEQFKTSPMKNHLTLFTLFATLLFSGCGVYHTQMTDIPLINRKNDVRIDAGVSLIPAGYSTVSYGLTDNIAIQGYGSISGEDIYYIQAATGLYRNMKNNRVMELYGGFGYGNGNAYNDVNPGHLYGNYQLYFGQFNYGKIANKNSGFELGLGIKAGYLHSNLTDRNYYNWVSISGPFDDYTDESLLFEPVGMMRIGRGRLKFSFKIGSTLIYKFTNTDVPLPYSKLKVGIGLNYRL
jgi:hypothetical protein